ncbi:MAG: TfoX/Sxy family protein [Clostridia bacterium]|nr:TfoX/Sxy family protein [Clostridia bacterium]
MASGREFVDYLIDQMREAGVITARKMFGEYGLWCNGKHFAFVCDDRFLLKSTNAVQALYPELPLVALFEGAGLKYLFIENVDDREFLTELVIKTYEELPETPPKRR